MESPTPAKTDPALLLLNEIDILQMQTRLVELYLKQVQITGNDRIARMQEQHEQELTALRSAVTSLEQSLAASESERDATPDLPARLQALESQLGDLQSLLEERDRALRESESARINIEHELRNKISKLENELQEARQAVELRDHELRAARAHRGALEQRIAELDAANRSADANAAELDRLCRSRESAIATLQAQVAAQERSLSERQQAVTMVELALHNKIQALQQELARQRGEGEEREREIDTAYHEAQALRQRIEELETVLASAERAQADHDTKRHEMESALSGLRTVLEQKESALARQQIDLRSTIEQLDAEIARHQTEAAILRQRVAALEAAAAAASQTLESVETERRALQDETGRLRAAMEQTESAAAQQQSELHSRLERLNVEIDSQRGAADGLRQKIAELEAALAEAQQVQENTETARRELEAEVADLGAALREKESAAAQRQSAVQSTVERLGIEIERGRAEADALRQRIMELESSVATAERAATTRGELEGEIATLRAALAEQESTSAKQQTEFNSSLDQLHSEIDRQRTEAERHRQTAEAAHAELENVRAAVAALEEQKGRDESTLRQLEENWRHASSSRRELETLVETKDREIHEIRSSADEAKDAALGEQLNHFRALEEQLNAEIGRFREQVQNQQTALGRANSELAQLRAAVAAREQDNACAEEARREIEQSWHQSRALCGELETRLQAKDEELRLAQTRVQELMGRLDSRVNELQLQLAEKQLLVESRGTEIITLKADLVRLSDQLAQRESALVAGQAELTAIDAAHQGTQKAWEDELAQEQRAHAELSQQISELEGQYRAVATRLKERENDLAAAAAEAATWRARCEEVETLRQDERAQTEEADRVRQNLDSEIATLRAEVEQKSWASAQQQAALQNLALAHKAQIQKLEAKIDEHQHGVERRDAELESARVDVQSLERRIEELESELKQAEETARTRSRQLAEGFSSRIDELNRQLTEATTELQKHSAVQSDQEGALRDEVDRLILEARERNRILQDRNDELVRVKTEMDQLQDRLGQTETSASERERELKGAAERLQTEYQARLAILQAELSQKDWALEEQRARNSGKVQPHREQLQSLRQQSATTKFRAQDNSEEFVLGNDHATKDQQELTEEQRERQRQYREVMDAVGAGDNRSFPAPEKRRWRSRFSWKRRWKS